MARYRLTSGREVELGERDIIPKGAVRLAAGLAFGDPIETGLGALDVAEDVSEIVEDLFDFFD